MAQSSQTPVPPEVAAASGHAAALVVEGHAALDRLAGRLGIQPEFTNAAGRTVVTSPLAKQELLAAMGLDASDEVTAAQRLVELDEAAAAAILPPVVVVHDTSPSAIPLGQAGATAFRWRLSIEGGEVLEGEHAGDALLLPASLPPGYHRLTVESEGRSAEALLIRAPERCYLPDAIEGGGRLWGLAVQLYTLRTARDWGIGDFTDLAQLVHYARDRGAAVIGLNPLHAGFPDRPAQASPYSPASRLFLNPLYIDPEAVPELAQTSDLAAWLRGPEFRARRDRLREADLVDYAAVSQLKMEVLERLFTTFVERGAPQRRAAFDAFRAAGGEALEQFCRFSALALARGRSEQPDVPIADPAETKAARLLDEHSRTVTFFAWLQWIADEQLGRAAELARTAGLVVGIYRDLAVGADPGGAEAWGDPGALATGARVGAPPDLFNPAGQNWGLPPLDPHRLREEGYRSFIELLRANMRHAGGLRIDHVMALQQLYWIPAGAGADAGAYVRYPLADLLAILALESQRHRCLVVGEDLGTVPPGFRERMAAAGVLSYRVLFFEWRGDGSFTLPDEYPYQALATAGSHDLATLRGWWEGHDNALKAQHGLFPDADEAASQERRRAQDRERLLTALREAGLELPSGLNVEAPWNAALGVAAHAFIARTRCAIAMVQLDDLAQNRRQVNLPGSVDEYPNWRRKLRLTLDELASDPTAQAVAALMADGRATPAIISPANSAARGG